MYAVYIIAFVSAISNGFNVKHKILYLQTIGCKRDVSSVRYIHDKFQNDSLQQWRIHRERNLI